MVRLISILGMLAAVVMLLCAHPNGMSHTGDGHDHRSQSAGHTSVFEECCEFQTVRHPNRMPVDLTAALPIVTVPPSFTPFYPEFSAGEPGAHALKWPDIPPSSLHHQSILLRV